MWALRKRPSEPVLSAWSDDEDGEEVVLWGHHRMERLAGKELQRERRTASMRRCLTAGVFCGAGAALTFTVGAILIALPRFIEMQHELINERTAFGAQPRAPQPVLSEEVMLTDTSVARAAPPSQGMDTLGKLSHALGLGQDVGLLRPGLATAGALAGGQESARSVPKAVGLSSRQQEQQRGHQQEQQQQGQQQARAPAHEPSVAAHFEPQFYRAAQCMSWCMTHERNGVPTPWPERCAWDTLACSACPECDAPVPGTPGDAGVAGALTPPNAAGAATVTALAAPSTDATNATSEQQAAGLAEEREGADAASDDVTGDQEAEDAEGEGEGEEGPARDGLADEGRQEEEEVDAEIDAVANEPEEDPDKGGGQQQQPAQEASNATAPELPRSAPEDPAQESRSPPEEPAQERQHTMQLASSWPQQQRQQRLQQQQQQQDRPQAVNDSAEAGAVASGVEANATADAAAEAPAAALSEHVANTTEQEAESTAANDTARVWEVRSARPEEAPTLDGRRRHQQGESAIAAAAAELRAGATREADLAAETMREAGQQSQRRWLQRQQEAADSLTREQEVRDSQPQSQRPSASR